jgi:hypothetical protein
MELADANRILFNRRKLTNKVRKQCMAARQTTMRSDTPICADRTPGNPTEYYSSKPLDRTPDNKLGRATLSQLGKWLCRSSRRNAHCLKLAKRTETARLKELLELKAETHAALAFGCALEIKRRAKKASCAS